jgi:two-component system response regulator FixJ
LDARHPVYLVDDDPHMRELIGFICKDIGITCRSFESGEQFLASIDELEPGCVLLDMRMPRKHGLQVQEEMVARGRPLPVVAMTGYGDVEMAVQSMRFGAVDFLEKPFETEVLVEALERGFARLEGGGEEPPPDP